MRRVLGYENGRAIWSENEQGCVARVQGFGGAAIGTFEGVTLTAKQRLRNQPNKRLPRQPLNRRDNGDDTVQGTPDNQGVEPTEYRRFRA